MPFGAGPCGRIALRPLAWIRPRTRQNVGGRHWGRWRRARRACRRRRWRPCSCSPPPSLGPASATTPRRRRSSGTSSTARRRRPSPRPPRRCAAGRDPRGARGRGHHDDDGRPALPPRRSPGPRPTTTAAGRGRSEERADVTSAFDYRPDGTGAMTTAEAPRPRPVPVQGPRLRRRPRRRGRAAVGDGQQDGPRDRASRTGSCSASSSPATGPSGARSKLRFPDTQGLPAGRVTRGRDRDPAAAAVRALRGDRRGHHRLPLATERREPSPR